MFRKFIGRFSVWESERLTVWLKTWGKHHGLDFLMDLSWSETALIGQSQTVSHKIKYSTYLQPVKSRRNCCSSSHSWPRIEQMFCISVVRITFWKTKCSHCISSKLVILNTFFFLADLSKTIAQQKGETQNSKTEYFFNYLPLDSR